MFVSQQSAVTLIQCAYIQILLRQTCAEAVSGDCRRIPASLPTSIGDDQLRYSAQYSLVEQIVISVMDQYLRTIQLGKPYRRRIVQILFFTDITARIPDLNGVGGFSLFQTHRDIRRHSGDSLLQILSGMSCRSAVLPQIPGEDSR